MNSLTAYAQGSSRSNQQAIRHLHSRPLAFTPGQMTPERAAHQAKLCSAYAVRLCSNHHLRNSDSCTSSSTPGSECARYSARVASKSVLDVNQKLDESDSRRRRCRRYWRSFASSERRSAASRGDDGGFESGRKRGATRSGLRKDTVFGGPTSDFEGPDILSGDGAGRRARVETAASVDVHRDREGESNRGRDVVYIMERVAICRVDGGKIMQTL
jgi:hypothetical protein